MMGDSHRPAVTKTQPRHPAERSVHLEVRLQEEISMRQPRMTAACAAVAAAFVVPAAHARINSIVVDSTTDIAATGNAPAYKRAIGRAFGSLDPSLPVNALITDIQLAPKNAAGQVE